MLAIAGAMVLTAALYVTGYLRFNYPTFTAYPVRGIDVSHHQGHIDWPKVARTGIMFAYIKATEGGDFTDPDFQRNWDGARNAQLLTGGYHFFTLCRKGSEQANNFIQAVPREPGSLPPAVDLEFVGNCANRPTRNEFDTELNAFLDAMEGHYGVKPVFYTTRGFLSEYLSGSERIPSGSLWIRDIFFEPRTVDSRKWAFWQFADRVRLDGIGGFVDLNVFAGNRKQLESILIR